MYPYLILSDSFCFNRYRIISVDYRMSAGSQFPQNLQGANFLQKGVSHVSPMRSPYNFSCAELGQVRNTAIRKWVTPVLKVGRKSDQNSLRNAFLRNQAKKWVGEEILGTWVLSRRTAVRGRRGGNDSAPGWHEYKKALCRCKVCTTMHLQICPKSIGG